MKTIYYLTTIGLLYITIAFIIRTEFLNQGE